MGLQDLRRGRMVNHRPGRRTRAARHEDPADGHQIGGATVQKPDPPDPEQPLLRRQTPLRRRRIQGQAPGLGRRTHLAPSTRRAQRTSPRRRPLLATRALLERLRLLRTLRQPPRLRLLQRPRWHLRLLLLPRPTQEKHRLRPPLPPGRTGRGTRHAALAEDRPLNRTGRRHPSHCHRRNGRAKSSRQATTSYATPTPGKARAAPPKADRRLRCRSHPRSRPKTETGSPHRRTARGRTTDPTRKRQPHPAGRTPRDRTRAPRTMRPALPRRQRTIQTRTQPSILRSDPHRPGRRNPSSPQSSLRPTDRSNNRIRRRRGRRPKRTPGRRCRRRGQKAPDPSQAATGAQGRPHRPEQNKPRDQWRLAGF